MKKYIPLLTILLLIVCIALIPKVLANTPQEPANPEKKETVTTEYAAIETRIGNSDDPDETLKDYLIEWGEKNGCEVSKDKHGNVMLTRPAKEGYDSAPSTILHGTDKQIASALYVLKNSSVRGALKVLYTSPGSGAQNISTDMLTADYLISIGKTEKNYISNSASGREEYLLSKTLDWVTPENRNAFQITFSGFNGGDSGFDTKSKLQNPIKIAGNFLATAKNQGIILELASFNGGTSADTIPQEVSFTLVVNDYDANRVNALFEKTSDTFDKNYGSTVKDATFTITPLEAAPDKVVSKDATNSIISYLYGFMNGVYAMSETGDSTVAASSNLGTANTSTGDFISHISITSSAKEKAAEMNDAHYKLCYLSGFDYKFEKAYPIWTANAGSSVIGIMQDYYKSEDGPKASSAAVPSALDCSWFAEKNPALDMIWMSLEKPEEIILKFLGD